MICPRQFQISFKCGRSPVLCLLERGNVHWRSLSKGRGVRRFLLGAAATYRKKAERDGADELEYRYYSSRHLECGGGLPQTLTQALRGSDVEESGVSGSSWTDKLKTCIDLSWVGPFKALPERINHHLTGTASFTNQLSGLSKLDLM